MRYFMYLLPLKTNVNTVIYDYPEWMTDDIKSKMINLTNTTPADKFVDVVFGAETDKEAQILLDNGCVEITSEEFMTWKTAKLLVLKQLQKQMETTNEPTN